MSAWGTGALAGAAAGLIASPYLARLTLTIPDRGNARWWVGAAPSRARLLTTAAFALAYGALAGGAAQWSALFPAFVALALFGAPLTIVDFEHHRLPDRLTYPLAASALILLAVAAAVRHDWGDLLRGVEAAAVIGAVFFAVYLVAPFGLGDVKLGAVLGLYLGWDDWVTVYYGILGGFVVGSVVGIALLATRRADRKTPLAFGPMLLVGALLVLAFDLTPTFVR